MHVTITCNHKLLLLVEYINVPLGNSQMYAVDGSDVRSQSGAGKAAAPSTTHLLKYV